MRYARQSARELSRPRPPLIKRVGVAAAALATGVAAAVSSASASNVVSQLPGASAAGTVVVTDSPHVTVNVAPNSVEDGTVKVSVVNKLDHRFSCYAPGVSTDDNKPAKLPNVVTTARIVSQSVDYYRTKPFVPRDGVNLPLIGVIPTDVFLPYVPQGSAGSIFGEDISTRANLSREWDQARLAGHTGDIAPFDLEPLGTKDLTVTLTTPGNGPRTDFPAAALLYCTDTTANPNQAYVFAGYESEAQPAPQAMGSLGSAGDRQVPGSSSAPLVLGSSR